MGHSSDVRVALGGFLKELSFPEHAVGVVITAPWDLGTSTHPPLGEGLRCRPQGPWGPPATTPSLAPRGLGLAHLTPDDKALFRVGSYLEMYVPLQKQLGSYTEDFFKWHFYVPPVQSRLLSFGRTPSLGDHTHPSDTMLEQIMEISLY